MEEGHGQVAHVLGHQRVHLGHDAADAGQATLAAQAGLRRARGAGREEEVAQAVGRHGALHHVDGAGPGERGQGALRPLGVEHQHPLVLLAHGAECRGEAGPLDEGEVGRLGHHELALGVRQVAGQFVAPMGRIGPDDHGAHQRGGLQPEDELGDVVEQHGHVERSVDPVRPEPGRPLGRPAHHVGVGQPEVARHETQMVVVRPGQDGPGARLGRREVVASLGADLGRLVSWGHHISKLL